MQCALATKVSVTSQPRCASVKAMAVDRRQTFGLIAAGVAAIIAAPSAEAIEIPFQNSIGGISKRGSLPSGTSEASASGYNLQGTKKQGVSSKQKKKLLAKVKSDATAAKSS